MGCRTWRGPQVGQLNDIAIKPRALSLVASSWAQQEQQE